MNTVDIRPSHDTHAGSLAGVSATVSLSQTSPVRAALALSLLLSLGCRA